MKKIPIIPFEITKEHKKRVKEMAREYQAAKIRVNIYPRKRPTLMKQLQVSTDEYDETGVVHFDEEMLQKIHPDDQAFIAQYVFDMLLIYNLEHGVAAIWDEKTRHIAEDTLLKGKRCKDLEQKYGIKECMIRRRKDDAIRFLSFLA